MHLSNKELVLRFYRQVIGGRNEQLLEQFISPDYIQHSPQLKDGLSGLREAIRQLAMMPLPPVPSASPVRLILEDGPFVVLLCFIDTGDKTQWVLDVFRITDGVITEHWDLVQETDPEQVASLPQPQISIKRIFSDGQTMICQATGYMAGKTYAVYDIYDLDTALVARHRRMIREQPEQMPHTNGMI